MQTPWGDIAVADAHVHFFSHGFFAALAAQKKATIPEIGDMLGWEIPASDPAALAARWKEELDRHGVERVAMIASVPGDEDSVAAAAGAHPERFYGYFMFNPLAPDALNRLNRALANGLRGICLFPAMHRFSVRDGAVTPVYEAAAKAGAIVFVHCGVLSVGVRAKLGLPSPFDMSFSNPIDLHAIALQFPSVRFVVPHFGAGYFREALMLCDLCPNVYLDTSSSNKWMRLQPADMSLSDVFRRALDVAGPERLLFGTDSSFFPRGWHKAIFDAQCRALGEIGVSSEVARGVLGGNLQSLLP